MRVMVATRRTQGACDDDYAWAVDGELAFLPMVECDWGGPADFRRGARYFLGLESGGETTTVEIADIDVPARDIVTFVAEQLAAVGWTAPASNHEAERLAGEMLGIAAVFPVGTVLEKRGGEIRARRVTQPSESTAAAVDAP
jgi:hypothetical protein